MAINVQKVSDSSSATSTNSAAVAKAAATASTTPSTDFAELIKSFLPGDANANVSEEALFSAGVGERISKLVGKDALAKYQTEFTSAQQSLKAADGFVPLEKASLAALKKLVSDGDLTTEQGDRVYTEAFNGAQLDDDKTSLFDDRGGANDPTIAIEKMDAAITKISQYITALGDTAPKELMSLANASASGSAAATAASASGAKNGGNAEGILFKPVTNNEGTLAVLPGDSFTNNIESVALLDSSGNVIESGKKNTGGGTAETGREKWVFSKPGASYPANLTVKVTLKDGTDKTYPIADPSKRSE